jgi:hypothetical protein
MEKDSPPKKSILRKIYNNSKASFKTFRRFQDSMRKEFPGLVNNPDYNPGIEKKEEKKEVKKDERRIQEVYERRTKYY